MSRDYLEWIFIVSNKFKNLIRNFYKCFLYTLIQYEEKNPPIQLHYDIEQYQQHDNDI